MHELLAIPVFKGKKNLTIFRSTNAGVLDFEGSKVCPEEFNLQVLACVDEDVEVIETRIRNLEQQVLNRFLDEDFLYLTSRRDYWERIVGHDRKVFYQATVSATYVKLIKTFDEFSARVIQGK